ncbi:MULTISPECIES: hypothetical protein [unclassified Acinetobacter]|jgi:hypothetical protein
MQHDNNPSTAQERSEKAQEKRRIPKYILLLVGLFLLAIAIYMLASWQG